MPEKLVLRELEPSDTVTRFSLGGEEFNALKIFIKRHAKYYHSQNITKTYVLVEPSKSHIFGYVSLVCSQVELTLNQPIVDNYPYHDYPCVKIVRLAVDKSLKKKGLGTDLVNWSVSITKEKIMPHIGCRFLVVDSKAGAIGFYEKCGFTMLDTATNKANKHPLLFMDLHKI